MQRSFSPRDTLLFPPSKRIIKMISVENIQTLSTASRISAHRERTCEESLFNCHAESWGSTNCVSRRCKISSNLQNTSRRYQQRQRRFSCLIQNAINIWCIDRRNRDLSWSFLVSVRWKRGKWVRFLFGSRNTSEILPYPWSQVMCNSRRRIITSSTEWGAPSWSPFS